MWCVSTNSNHNFKFPDTVFAPNYVSPGEYLLNKIGDLPVNFKTDFPEFCYNYPDFQKLKFSLNSKKHELDKFNADPELMKSFGYVARHANPYAGLCGNHGILVKEYNAEIVTNAWLKMYECLPWLNDLLKSRCNTRRNNNQIFNSLHIAEAPGNFILSINHYLHNHYPKINWHWLASTYRELYKTEDKYLKDDYGIIRSYNYNWIFGADGDGDITSVNNILDFQNSVLKKFRGELADFVTSDVKYVPVDNDFDEEENINKPAHFGQILTGLLCLKPGGYMLVKELTMFESNTISYLYLLACTFKNVDIIKPAASKAANSEVYVLCRGYLNNLTIDQINKLLNIARYIRALNTPAGSPAIFLQNDIPAGFVNNLLQIVKQLTQQQIIGIDKMITNYKTRGKINVELQQKMCRDWIVKYNVKPLAPDYKILKSRYKK